MTDTKGLGKTDQEGNSSASAPTELPPSYDIALSQSESQQQDQSQVTGNFPILVLDGTKIY
ncbi:hypothetical protein FVEG_16511 [Fusarium verticillioides 7600]|uniref:Uncharacterized protein n=1 Tax=Gibberella moniliformis (strain M3125 / FGSC 7600) TaxID=334819 RepID=W7MPN3_GIBM7|nr:hypothetical protein FVEG_16511 [Fusarium verticillioides 7600]EWG49555.1 hypothetical protein FVEG_16511 [Fusarium verticillioides 7600]